MHTYSFQCFTVSVEIGGKSELLFLIDIFIFRRLREKGLNLFFNQSVLNGLLHFQKCLQHVNIVGGKKVGHMRCKERTKSILPASQ